jgi:streptomycin 6-kinase
MWFESWNILRHVEILTKAFLNFLYVEWACLSARWWLAAGSGGPRRSHAAVKRSVDLFATATLDRSSKLKDSAPKQVEGAWKR